MSTENKDHTEKNDHKESLLEQVKDKLRDFAGLPPGRFPDGEPKPSADTHSPTGTLTSDDAEGLPPHGGTGIRPTE
jgi:hypothetical protein